jgi:hypothetical protein
VNRAATAWLIRRFIDPGATIMFVAPEEVAEVQRREGATGFDAPGATYPHRDAAGRCSFEALVAEHCADDSALQVLARIVRGADFPDQIAIAPESAGLRAISVGFPLVARDDGETVKRPRSSTMHCMRACASARAAALADGLAVFPSRWQCRSF